MFTLNLGTSYFDYLARKNSLNIHKHNKEIEALQNLINAKKSIAY